MNARIRLLLIAVLFLLIPGLNILQAAEATLCYYAGESYSQGACRGGQRCGSDGSWFDDSKCKSAEEAALAN